MLVAIETRQDILQMRTESQNNHHARQPLLTSSREISREILSHVAVRNCWRNIDVSCSIGRQSTTSIGRSSVRSLTPLPFVRRRQRQVVTWSMTAEDAPAIGRRTDRQISRALLRRRRRRDADRRRISGRNWRGMSRKWRNSRDTKRPLSIVIPHKYHTNLLVAFNGYISDLL